MRLLLLCILFIGIFSSFSCDQSESTTDDMNFLGSTIYFADKTESAHLLGTSDEFTKSQSIFDIQSKTNNASNTMEEDYLTYAKMQALNWTEEEIEKCSKTIRQVEQKIKALNLKLDLPDSIKMVKSTMKEEGGAAGYTRRKFIVLGTNPSEALFTHELFHIISRHNSTVRDQLYKTISFDKMKKLTYPESLQARKITNPDAPFFEHFLNTTIDGESKAVILVTLAKREWEGGSFFKYLELKLLDVNTLTEENPTLYDLNQSSDFVEKVGRNTNYTIHPEEILAEHFTTLVMGRDAKDKQFIDSVQELLK